MISLDTTKSQRDEWDAERHCPHAPAVRAADVLMKVNVPGPLFFRATANLGRNGQQPQGI